MDAPKINISFIEKAQKSFRAANRGTVALMIGAKPIETLSNPFSVVTEADIPASGLTDAEKDQIKLALKGYEGISPAKIIVYCMGKPRMYTRDELAVYTLQELRAIEEAAGYTIPETDDVASHVDAIFTQQSATVSPAYTSTLEAMENIKFNYIVFTEYERDKALVPAISNLVTDWIKNHRNGFKAKAVLPNTAADTEGVINYTVHNNVVAETVKVNGEEVTTETSYTAGEFCSRIAGLIAATPTNNSATYAVLDDVVDCTKVSDKDTAADQGKFIIFNDGEKIKTSRAINSLQTTTDTKGEDFKKIRIVEIMDIIHNDIKQLVEDKYLGKYPNTYDNKCVLISAIDEYLNELGRENMISSHTVEIDVDAQREYLKSKGQSVEEMTENEIKVADTGSKIFLTGNLTIVDAIEDLDWTIYI